MAIKNREADHLPAVSVIINNYNYESFVGQAIDSSLKQSYSKIEVIVVDDGSKDKSAEIIKSYGNQVNAIIKQNGGQASAMNVGFEASSGDLILFLDADDYLFPNAVETIVSAWQPGVAQIQSRLNLVDIQGQYIDLYPAPEIDFDVGDVLPLLLTKGRYNTTVTSGNCFSRKVMEKILPIPEEEFRISADGYLVTVAPFYGEVRAVETVIGGRRKHGNNLWASSNSGLTPEKIRKSVEHDFLRYKYLKKTAYELSHETKKNFELRDHLHVQDRIVSLRLDPENHPISEDIGPLLGWRGFWSIWKYSTYSWTRKVILGLWFLVVGIVPRSLAVQAINWKLAGKSRPQWADYMLKKIRFATR